MLQLHEGNTYIRRDKKLTKVKRIAINGFYQFEDINGLPYSKHGITLAYDCPQHEDIIAIYKPYKNKVLKWFNSLLK